MKRVTYPAACVLQALDDGETYGFGIMEATGLPSGTVYQLLRRFERAGLVRSRWEDGGDATDHGRPRRRYYELTRAGQEARVRTTERYGRHLAGLERPVSS